MKCACCGDEFEFEDDSGETDQTTQSFPVCVECGDADYQEEEES